MQNFEYHNPVRLIFGKNQWHRLPELIPVQHKIMMIYGGGSILKNGVYQQVKEALSNYTIIEFSGIEPNPTYETCMNAVEVAKQENVTFLLAVGGGSVGDATKFIAHAVLSPLEDPWDIIAKGIESQQALPLGIILTLPATGTEMNGNSVISRITTNEKRSFASPLSYPQFSFLLPEAAATLPKKQIANGIVDSFIHVIEQYLTYPTPTPLQDRFAEAILLTLIEEGPKVFENPAQYDAMCNLMWCATMALNGQLQCATAQDWSAHLIGHELTALHQLDHARSLAIVLPGIWHILKEEKKEKLLQYAIRVWGIKEPSEEETIQKAITKTEAFFHSLDIPTRLSDYHITQDTIQLALQRLKQRNWLAFGDRQLITLDIVQKILENRL